MSNFYNFLDNIENQQRAQDELDSQILDNIKAQLTNDQYNEILEFLNEEGSSYNYMIVESHGGHFQQEGYWFKYIYIEQHSTYIEDEYYGIIWIPLPDNTFLSFHFLC